MADGLTHVWTHGTAVQFNEHDTNPGRSPMYEHLDVFYTSDGCEIAPPRDGYSSNWELIVYLPIPTPPAISDALTSFHALGFRYRTLGEATISKFRLVRNNGIEYAMADLHFPLEGDSLQGLRPGENYWNPLYPNNNLIGGGRGSCGVCLEIIINFKPSDNPASVLIAGAGVVFKHKKFDYE